MEKDHIFFNLMELEADSMADSDYDTQDCDSRSEEDDTVRVVHWWVDSNGRYKDDYLCDEILKDDDYKNTDWDNAPVEHPKANVRYDQVYMDYLMNPELRFCMCVKEIPPALVSRIPYKRKTECNKIVNGSTDGVKKKPKLNREDAYLTEDKVLNEELRKVCLKNLCLPNDPEEVSELDEATLSNVYFLQ